ncbi:cytochrome c oxidase assembly protein COX11, mitochondrial isoform X2 [Gossypium hirsutum]|uniref:Cytochrome c oxidase assembly protein COX11, mitochondrial isoform X2 n=1 Tax=Gossypium hirsutum TaxID=3635 RepID=A0A1U8MIW7_GOSHI|nr:cytochrome c oxidase assembly protein COX11, mitochondrial isoform X2 [Gossypium hirsutum]XP_040930534.1 cytochrome c oxidase assembly protein COX11, mitochondrial isoform X2 [Gossypium hirsutum]
MPWKFVPTQREVGVKPGEVLLLFILLKTEVQNITGVSTYNVTPMKLLFISIKSSSFALRSSVFFLESRLTCLFSST